MTLRTFHHVFQNDLKGFVSLATLARQALIAQQLGDMLAFKHAAIAREKAKLEGEKRAQRDAEKDMLRAALGGPGPPLYIGTRDGGIFEDEPPRRTPAHRP